MGGGYKQRGSGISGPHACRGSCTYQHSFKDATSTLVFALAGAQGDGHRHHQREIKLKGIYAFGNDVRSQ